MAAKDKELKNSQDTLGNELAEKKKLLDDFKKEVQMKETKILTLGKEWDEARGQVMQLEQQLSKIIEEQNKGGPKVGDAANYKRLKKNYKLMLNKILYMLESHANSREKAGKSLESLGEVELGQK